MSEPLRVLLADHEEPLRQMAGDALRSAGFECDSFPDGERAAAALQAGAYDLLVVSIAMPGNRDFELLPRAGGEPVGIPVIVLAKPASRSTAVTALRLGAVDYLVKPLKIADLVKAVKKAGEKAFALRTVRSVQRVIGVCAGWFRELETVLATPGRLLVPAPVRSTLVEMTGHVQPLRDALLWGNLEPKEVAALSPREREVLRALVAGRRVREIARALGIALNPGRKPVRAILRKLGVHSQPELIERFR